MHQKKWKIQGIKVLNKSEDICSIVGDFDLISIVSFCLYYMDEIKWIDEVWLCGMDTNAYLAFYVKAGFDIIPARKIMESTMDQLKSHFKNVGFNVDIVSGDNSTGPVMDWELIFESVRIKFWLESW